MLGKVAEADNIGGLSTAEALSRRKQFGPNLFEPEYSRRPLQILADTIREPMFLMLSAACTLYFILGQLNEGFMMLAAMTVVVSISIYQEVRSSNALKELQQLTALNVTVIRDGNKQTISSDELVPQDVMLLEEGMHVPADAVVLQENDLTLNESVITGESVPADKHAGPGFDTLYQGTSVNSGACIARVTATGSNTILGKLGKAVGSYQSPKTLLQRQINRFVRRLALFGVAGFAAVFIVNFSQHHQFTASLLLALTLAMSAVPEEIPVAFSSFMALGAFKMSRLGIISRQPQVVENLGAVSVICLDKTGTITENKMSVKVVYDGETDELIELGGSAVCRAADVLVFAVLASEKSPFDSMEQAILQAYNACARPGDHLPERMIYEYPLEGRPPMMTHVYEHAGITTAAAKGAVERILSVCNIDQQEQRKALQVARTLASNGYRVIAVASAVPVTDEMPLRQDDFNWLFKGLLALYDPPKKNMAEVIRSFYEANIVVKLLTGDYPETALNIAGRVGIRDISTYITGEQVLQMDKAVLTDVVRSTSIFVRMFPDAKLKVIEALKSSGEIVAMTGDGVNDGPALKAADIGIAMGLKGTQIARQASDLVLTGDDLGGMVSAIREGRKIFSNLKKAVRYIISIHIPIILVASLPLVLGWRFPNIFTPIHVIFMELIMGPTCSIFFEREPVEENIMRQSPRERNKKLFARSELFITITQGLVISAGALALYYYFMESGAGLAYTRTVVFINLVVSNIFLTFADRSFTMPVYYTIRYKNNLAPIIVIVSVCFICAMYFIPYLQELFQLTTISSAHFWLSAGVAFGCVMWFELYKTIIRISMRKPVP